MKMTNQKRFAITTILLFAMLVSCLPMSEEQIYAKAESIYVDLEKPEAQEKKDTGVADLKRKDLAEEQVLHLAGRYMYNLSPTNASYASEWTFTNQVYVGLTRQDAQTLEFLPALAREWNVSDDGKIWTFKLQEDLPWVRYNEDEGEVQMVRDGLDQIHYVNSADLEAGIMRTLSPELNSYNKYNLFLIEGAEDYSLGNAEEISGINIISDTEIEFTLNEPCGYLDALAEMTAYAAYPAWLNIPVDSDDMEKILDYSYGPFVMQSYEPGAQITLIRNPYWKGTEGLPVPYLDEIHYDLNEDQDVITEYQEGALDVVQLSRQEYMAAMEDPLLAENIHISQGSCGYYLIFRDFNDPNYSSKTLRQAIAAGINKENLAEYHFDGFAQVLDQFVPANIRGASEYPKDIGIAYEPVSAASEIEKADLDVDELDITLLALESQYGIAQEIEIDIQKTLNRDILTLHKDAGGFYDLIWSDSDDAMMYIIGNCLDYADAQSMWSFWDPDGPFAGVVTGEWQETEFHELLQEGASVTAVSQRQKSYGAAEDIIINQDTVIIPLFSENQLWLVNPKLAAEFSPLFPHLENWAFVK